MDNRLADNATPPRDEDTVLASAVDSKSEPQPPPSGQSRAWLPILAAILLVAGPLVYLALPDEIARWYVAAAMERQLDGETERALACLEKAEFWSPGNPALYTCHGDWKLEQNDYAGSVEQYNRALQMDPSYTAALVGRSQALQHLGRHDQAIADWKRLLEKHSGGFSGRRAMFLNGLAYAQALGNTELESALENVNAALDLVGHDGAILDTRGYIHYQRGDYKSARADLDLAVSMIEKAFEPHQKERDTRQFVDRRTHEADFRTLAKSVAVIRYHRALAYDALDKPDQAERDRRRVRELGFEPGEDLF
jgi:tetratricopeptide (TPR) repeat protein